MRKQAPLERHCLHSSLPSERMMLTLSEESACGFSRASFVFPRRPDRASSFDSSVRYKGGSELDHPIRVCSALQKWRPAPRQTKIADGRPRAVRKRALNERNPVMNISSLSSLDYSTSTSSTQTNKSNKSNPLSNALSSLENDLTSGDTSDATSLLSSLLSNAPSSTSDSSSSTDSSDSSSVGGAITSYLQSLQNALSSGDTTSAASVLSDLNDYLNQNTPFQTSNAGTYASDGTLTSASSSTASALSTLI